QVMASMNIDTVDVYPRVSEHIEDIVAAIQKLIDQEYAYAVDGDVYFDVKQFPAYGKLSRRTVDELEAGKRIEIDERKKSPADFALWKGAKPDEPSWPSPWGPGRPGWHIECSVMSIKHLGYPVDLHGGGLDLLFPHHENEIAQAEAFQGEGPFVRYWLHTGLLQMHTEKMSKSLGNFVRARDLIDRYGPQIVRLYILWHHYRSPREFSDERMEEARTAWQRLNNTVTVIRGHLAHHELPAGARSIDSDLAAALQSAREAFDAAMRDDLNTAQAVAALFDLVRQVNGYMHGVEPGMDLDNGGLQQILDFFEERGSMLGILPADESDSSADETELTEKLIALCIELRETARQERDWDLADRIRDGLSELGITVEDTARGPRVRRERAG
ncbi:MAG: cysteine--tRNA ligase, partial [Thermaerobacterales bacterium]